MRRIGFVVAVALSCAACGANSAEQRRSDPVKPSCTAQQLASWKKLAQRIQAPVYCPSWLPDPLDGAIGSRSNNIDVVSRDRSYLESWVWQETGPGAASGELHVNLRGYPGRTKIPTCFDQDEAGHVPIACFTEPLGKVSIGPIHATAYAENQDADYWHILYAWRFDGSLYTVSEHVAPPLNRVKVRRYLDRIVRGLVLVRPPAS